jgi:hypothetical protein
MREPFLHRGLTAVAAGLAFTVLAFAFGIALHTTATPGAAAAQEPAKAEPKGLPILAAGFVTAEGQLTRAAGAKLTVARGDRDISPDKRRQEGVYRVTFAQELSSVPVVVVTGITGRVPVICSVEGATKKGFTVICIGFPYYGRGTGAAARASSLYPLDCGFNFIVVKASEAAP